MFFSRKKQDSSVALKQIADLITMLEKRISSMEVEVDMIRLRLRKKTFWDAIEEPEAKAEESKIDDGFDELRKLNKEYKP